jgi:hypothetical protein
MKSFEKIGFSIVAVTLLAFELEMFWLRALEIQSKEIVT